MLGQHHLQVVLLVATLLSACSSSHRTSDNTRSTSGQKQEGEKAPLSTYEATFQPSAYDEAPEVVEQQLAAQQEPSDLRRDSVAVEEETLQGYRIQIFASSRIDEALLAKQTAAQLITTDSLYIVFDPPVYKLRVGDYRTRLDANRALASIIQKGYPDAWIVSDRIVQRHFVRIRREEY
jgi:hypothetical protein